MTKITQPFQSHERPAAEQRPEMFRRLNVINAATDAEHMAEFVAHPDLFQQPAAVSYQPAVNPVEAAPAGGVAIDLAARREQQVATAEEQRLSAIREQVERLAA